MTADRDQDPQALGNAAGKANENAISGNPPVAPVDDYDLGKVDKDRRIFGNGDTDREDQTPKAQ